MAIKQRMRLQFLIGLHSRLRRKCSLASLLVDLRKRHLQDSFVSKKRLFNCRVAFAVAEICANSLQES